MPELSSLPDIAEASAILDGLEASQTDPLPEHFQQSDEGAQQTAQEGDKGTNKPDSTKNSDAQATAKDQKQDGSQSEDKKPSTEPAKPAKEPSAFAKSQERLDKTWKSVNERKAQLDTRESTIKQREEALASRERDIAVKQAKSRSQFSPEQYEQAAGVKLNTSQQLDQQATMAEALKEKLEAAGDYIGAARADDQAKRLREQAAGERHIANQMRQHAAHLRANPEPTVEQYNAQKEKEGQHYTLEAAKKWPQLAESGSEFQKQTAANLKTAEKYGLDFKEHPAIMYFAAEMTAHALAAARVPGLEKELGELKAKVKDYEKRTAPGGGTEAAAKTPQSQTPQDEEAELRSMAMSLS